MFIIELIVENWKIFAGIVVMAAFVCGWLTVESDRNAHPILDKVVNISAAILIIGCFYIIAKYDLWC